MAIVDLLDYGAYNTAAGRLAAQHGAVVRRTASGLKHHLRALMWLPKARYPDGLIDGCGAGVRLAVAVLAGFDPRQPGRRLFLGPSSDLEEIVDEAVEVWASPRSAPTEELPELSEVARRSGDLQRRLLRELRTRFVGMPANWYVAGLAAGIQLAVEVAAGVDPGDVCERLPL